MLVFVVYNRRREAQIKYPNPDDDIRENIINYEDEGGGEDDMTAFDITPLQIPVAADPNLGHHSLPRSKIAATHCESILSKIGPFPASFLYFRFFNTVDSTQNLLMTGFEPLPTMTKNNTARLKIAFCRKFPDPPSIATDANVETFIEDHKKRADLDPSAPPFDDLRNYAYEGGGSTAGSLSSLGSGE